MILTGRDAFLPFRCMMRLRDIPSMEIWLRPGWTGGVPSIKRHDEKMY